MKGLKEKYQRYLDMWRAIPGEVAKNRLPNRR